LRRDVPGMSLFCFCHYSAYSFSQNFTVFLFNIKYFYNDKKAINLSEFIKN
jgi:hypothetical protein